MNDESRKMNKRSSVADLGATFARQGIFENKDSPDTTPYNEKRKKRGYRVKTERNEKPNSEKNQLIEHKESSNFSPVEAIPFIKDKHNQELSTTFMHMEYRKLKRASSGSYRDKPRGSLWLIAYLAVFGAYLTYQFLRMQQDECKIIFIYFF